MDIIKTIIDFFQYIIGFTGGITFYDILEIVILSWLAYKGIKLVQETRAEQLLKGIGFLFVLFLLVKQFGNQLKVMNFILENFFQVGIIAVIIMFQPELRRALEKVGRTKVTGIGLGLEGGVSATTHMVDSVVRACINLSRSATGAIIVVERQTKLGEQIDTGTLIKATPSNALLENIFYPNTPLHDGAVIIRDNQIYAAGCFLPKPQKEELISKALGSRHRAAIGCSEVSDALVLVVSEETGTISVAENGKLIRNYSKESLTQLLLSRLVPEPDEKKSRIKKRLKNVKESEENKDD